MAPRKRRSVDEHQLDLFADSEDVGRRNTVVAALLRRDALQAGAAIEALRAALPTDSILGPASVLHAHLIAPSQTIADHALAASELQRLRETILPAADYLFGASSAAEWIRADWVAMAERIAGLDFDGRWPDIHSSALLCMLSRWEEALALALRVASWRRIAVIVISASTETISVKAVAGIVLWLYGLALLFAATANLVLFFLCAARNHPKSLMGYRKRSLRSADEAIACAVNSMLSAVIALRLADRR
ncbi:hypothetical protein [Thauera sp. WH-1]|uniref:hypothetical protein n=1 Tax=Thauera sp. WH-1 TaxID=3398230 RepID=UPI0039FD5D4A